MTAIFSISCDKTEKEKQNESFDIVCTVFPQYSWVKSLTDGAENVNVTLILDDGTDFHSYQPTADDVIKMSDCDALIYIGGASDAWASKVSDSKARRINLMEIIKDDIKEEQLVEGMQDEEHAGEHTEEHNNEQELEYDEHIFLSVKNAVSISEKLAEIFEELDPSNAEVYKNNLIEYKASLCELDGEFEKTVENAKNKVMIVADRFPFRYLADDYGIKYYAAFPGCSSETDASFDTVIFLAEKLKESGLDKIAVTENSDKKTAESVIAASHVENVGIILLDSMQSVSKAEIDGGITYTDIMKSNLSALGDLLG